MLFTFFEYEIVKSRKYYNQIKEIKIRMLIHNMTL